MLHLIEEGLTVMNRMASFNNCSAFVGHGSGNGSGGRRDGEGCGPRGMQYTGDGLGRLASDEIQESHVRVLAMFLFREP